MRSNGASKHVHLIGVVFDEQVFTFHNDMQIIVVAALICRDGYSRFGLNMQNRGLQPYGSRQLLENSSGPLLTFMKGTTQFCR